MYQARHATYQKYLKMLQAKGVPQKDIMDELNRLVRRAPRNGNVWQNLCKGKRRPNTGSVRYLGTTGLLRFLRAEIPGYSP